MNGSIAHALLLAEDCIAILTPKRSLKSPDWGAIRIPARRATIMKPLAVEVSYMEKHAWSMKLVKAVKERGSMKSNRDV